MDATVATGQHIRKMLTEINDRLSRSTRLLVGLTLAGALLRIYLLGDKSIWLDEAFSMVLSQRSLDDLLRLTVQTDTHPPLYYVALKYWLALGRSEGHVRLLSAIFSTASIPLTYAVVSSLYKDTKAGLLGAAVMALSPFQIWYAQEARMYAMLTFFVLASVYFFIQALREGRRKDWAGYVLATSLALYMDNGAIWYVVATTIFFLLSRERFPGRSKQWLASQGAILVLYGPWLPSLLRQTRQVTQSFWLPPPSFQTVLGTFLDFNSFNFPWISLSVLYMTVIFVWAYIVPQGGWQRRLATMLLFVPLLISLLLSLRQPIFLSRNLIVASLGYYLLVVDTIRKFDSARVTAALVLPLLAMNLISIGHNAWVEEKEDWRSLAEHVASSARNRQDGLIVFVPAYTELPFSYYFRQQDVELETQGYPADEILLHPDPQQVQDLEELLADRPIVWLVLRDVEAVDPQWQVKDWLDSNGYVRGTDYAGSEISALTYLRWDLLRDGPRASPPPPESDESHNMFFPHMSRNVFEPTPPPPTIHVVARGDTLWVIARRYETTVEAIMEANEIANPNRLSVGQELVIP